MKNRALLSSKDKSKKLQCCLLQFLFGTLRDNPLYTGRVDSSTVICLMSPFFILGASGLFCHFSSIF